MYFIANLLCQCNINLYIVKSTRLRSKYEVIKLSLLDHVTCIKKVCFHCMWPCPKKTNSIKTTCKKNLAKKNCNIVH